MSCIVTPKPPAPHAPCMRALAPNYDINTQTRRPGEPGVCRLHTDQGGEFQSTSLEKFCQWKGIIHTFTDRAQHQSNGLVER